MVVVRNWACGLVLKHCLQSLHLALQPMKRVNDDLAEIVASWRDALEHEMLAAAPDAVVLGRESERLANTLCIAHPRIDAETMVMSFDLAGVAVSAGLGLFFGQDGGIARLAVAMGHDGLDPQCCSPEFGVVDDTGGLSARCGSLERTSSRVSKNGTGRP